MDPKAFFSLRPPGHPSPFQKQFGSEKSTEVEFPYGFPTSHVIKDCPKKNNPCSHESNRLGLLVPAANDFFSFCFFKTVWPWHISNIWRPLLWSSTVLLDWGTSEGTTNDSSDSSVLYMFVSTIVIPSYLKMASQNCIPCHCRRSEHACVSWHSVWYSYYSATVSWPCLNPHFTVSLPWALPLQPKRHSLQSHVKLSHDTRTADWTFDSDLDFAESDPSICQCHLWYLRLPAPSLGGCLCW